MPQTISPSLITPEQLSPSDSLKNMRYAFTYCAGAVYADHQDSIEEFVITNLI
ncbi:hypothetical protein ABFY09_10445 [Marinomonas sp. 5E14-1]|uniref:hypothetical protein n=1 Tax=Marinomonas sp. 5E14-1 TaxID=3153922 RepID=UPI003262F723